MASDRRTAFRTAACSPRRAAALLALALAPLAATDAAAYEAGIHGVRFAMLPECPSNLARSRTPSAEIPAQPVTNSMGQARLIAYCLSWQCTCTEAYFSSSIPALVNALGEYVQ